jgi:hypothetical protein
MSESRGNVPPTLFDGFIHPPRSPTPGLAVMDSGRAVMPEHPERRDAPKRRGRPSGPSLKVLLTKLHPDGATAEQLAKDGFLGDLDSALKRRSVQLEEDGRYVWIGDATPDCTRASEDLSKIDIACPSSEFLRQRAS